MSIVQFLVEAVILRWERQAIDHNPHLTVWSFLLADLARDDGGGVVRGLPARLRGRSALSLAITRPDGETVTYSDGWYPATRLPNRNMPLPPVVPLRQAQDFAGVHREGLNLSASWRRYGPDGLDAVAVKSPRPFGRNRFDQFLIVVHHAVQSTGDRMAYRPVVVDLLGRHVQQQVARIPDTLDERSLVWVIARPVGGKPVVYLDGMVPEDMTPKHMDGRGRLRRVAELGDRYWRDMETAALQFAERWSERTNSRRPQRRPRLSVRTPL